MFHRIVGMFRLMNTHKWHRITPGKQFYINFAAIIMILHSWVRSHLVLRPWPRVPSAILCRENNMRNQHALSSYYTPSTALGNADSVSLSLNHQPATVAQDQAGRSVAGPAAEPHLPFKADSTTLRLGPLGPRSPHSLICKTDTSLIFMAPVRIWEFMYSKAVGTVQVLQSVIAPRITC